jgi:hypothetical protein
VEEVEKPKARSGGLGTIINYSLNSPDFERIKTVVGQCKIATLTKKGECVYRDCNWYLFEVSIAPILILVTSVAQKSTHNAVQCGVIIL